MDWGCRTAGFTECNSPGDDEISEDYLAGTADDEPVDQETIQPIEGTEITLAGTTIKPTARGDPGVTDDCESDREEILSALVQEPEHFRFVLAEGQFVEAEGFEIAHDGLLARGLSPSEEEVEKHHGMLSYSLTWRVPDD